MAGDVRWTPKPLGNAGLATAGAVTAAVAAHEAAANPHPGYLTQAEADALYAVLGAGGGLAEWGTITGVLASQTDLAAALAGKQPLDADLTAIAALATTAFGRTFLDLADAAAARTKLALGSAALSASGDFQPIDSDLTAIAALATTAFGRTFLDLADAAAGRTKLALGTLATQSGTFSGNSSGTNTGDQNLSGYATTAGVVAGYQPLDSDLTAIAALATTAFGRTFLDLADAAAGRTKLGLGSAALSASGDFQPIDSDLTAIAALATTAYGRALLVLADQAALTALIAVATGALSGAMSAQDKTRFDAVHNTYRTVLDSSGSHIAARVAGTYGMGQGDPLAISGTGTLYPLNLLHIAAADYPARGTLAAKLRIRCALAVNDVAPTGNFTIGLHPVTRPATSGGAGLGIYTVGAAVAGSTVAVNTPAADSLNNAVGADFALPADGPYVIGVVTTATVAASSHLHFSAALQMRYA